MTQSEVARALTTVQDVLVKRQKRASAAGVTLPGLQNYTQTSTRGLNKGELAKQLKFAVQASQNKTSSIQGVKQVQKETWNRIKKQLDTIGTEEPEDEEYNEKEIENPFEDPEFVKNFWGIYNTIKDKIQGFGTNGSWGSPELQKFIYEKLQRGVSKRRIIKQAVHIARERYKQQQRINEEIEKEMEPEGYYGNNTDFEIDGDEDLFDL